MTGRGWNTRLEKGQPARACGAVVRLAVAGFVPDDVSAAPRAAVNRLAVQLGVPLAELEGYGTRGQTRTEHLRLVAGRLEWRLAKDAEWKDLEEFLLARAMEHDAPSVLFRLVCEYCSSARIIRPGVVPLMRAVATAREAATAETFLRVQPLLPAQRCEELDALLVAGEDLRISRLAWLHRGATTASPMAIRAELDKLRFLRDLDAHALDLSVLPEARRRRLAGIGRRSTNQALARRDDDKRYPTLLATVADAPSRSSTRWSACSTRRCPGWRTVPGASSMTCGPNGRGPRKTG